MSLKGTHHTSSTDRRHYPEDTRSEWDDYGFGFVGSSTTPHWLSHSTLKASVELDVIWDNDEVVNAENLLKQLNKRKALILKQISER